MNHRRHHIYQKCFFAEVWLKHHLLTSPHRMLCPLSNSCLHFLSSGLSLYRNTERERGKEWSWRVHKFTHDEIGKGGRTFRCFFDWRRRSMSRGLTGQRLWAGCRAIASAAYINMCQAFHHQIWLHHSCLTSPMPRNYFNPLAAIAVYLTNLGGYERGTRHSVYVCAGVWCSRRISLSKGGTIIVQMPEWNSLRAVTCEGWPPSPSLHIPQLPTPWDLEMERPETFVSVCGRAVDSKVKALQTTWVSLHVIKDEVCDVTNRPSIG